MSKCKYQYLPSKPCFVQTVNVWSVFSVCSYQLTCTFELCWRCWVLVSADRSLWLKPERPTIMVSLITGHLSSVTAFKASTAMRNISEKGKTISILVRGLICPPYYPLRPDVLLVPLPQSLTVFTCWGTSVSSMGHSSCFIYQYELKDIMNKHNSYMESCCNLPLQCVKWCLIV